MLASSFATTFLHLYITYGVIFGIGCSLAYTPSLVILGHYFNKRLGIVNGVVTAGSSVFTMIMAIALSAVLKAYELREALRFLAGLMAMLIFAGATFIERKPPLHEVKIAAGLDPLDKQSRPKLFNADIWRNKLYILWVLAIPIALFGYFVPYVHLVQHVSVILPHANGELLVSAWFLLFASSASSFDVLLL